ncbi:hypothetical protein EJ05DRAFT_480878 [Pseudovirgaria hyperparasitica]|uniref:Mob1/phocein n=1 Tax=Pseudovirgaria hyperparasitica TaxID=470096 RepID=A0A6A6VTD9_9PEZI|nr:uncharacterized protein EJ05DRAFT_480878 [Pseudovirgaria hyperparasitica]KAF2752860.1 hypothetical protein EJ05DRAFT_480878 [Pseudovirgaria hyperparasitica]
MAAFITTMFVLPPSSNLSLPGQLEPLSSIPPSMLAGVAAWPHENSGREASHGYKRTIGEPESFCRSSFPQSCSSDWEGGSTLDGVMELHDRLKSMMIDTEHALELFETELVEQLSLRCGQRRNSRTRAPFKPNKSGRGTSSWQLKQFAEATLGSGSLRKAVKLPEGEDFNEWLAVNVVDFYNQINLLYGSITEFCSPQSCPEMKATDEFEYLWQDNENFKRPTKMTAPEYVEHLMAWIQSNIDNEQMFPSRIGVAFPKAFPSLLRQIFKRLYRVYAHIYCHHYPVVVQLGLEPHLNTSFKHYVLFIDEHNLSSGSKDYWGPLGDLVESMLKSD